MAARLTDKQKKKILADYIQVGSCNAVAKAHGVSATTVKNIVLKNADIVQKCEDKKEENTRDILEYMDGQRGKVCDIIDLYLDELLKIDRFEKLTPNQLTTAMGTLIDKFTASGGRYGANAEEDALSRSLRELGKELESDG